MTQAHIFQINTSPGGVPKTAQQIGDVTLLGLSGDQQRDLEHHGGPTRALCLYSLERILDLQREGHPIYPGMVGENVTITGLDWPKMVPGVRLWLGQEVHVEITSYANPCTNIQSAFANDEFNRISVRKHPEWSRIYVKVLQTGRIRVGDVVRVEGVG